MANPTTTTTPNLVDLSDRHLQMLHESAIADQVIAARGYRTITDADELQQLGFSVQQARTPGLLIPLWTPDSDKLYVYRPDNPRVIEDKSKKNPDGTHPNKVIKYEYPKGATMRLDCPPSARAQMGDPAIPLWITEGQKKADSLVSAGLCAISLLGVWNWRGTNDIGGKVLLPDWNYIALNGRDVRIVFDSDVMNKPGVRQALRALMAMLANKHASVTAVYLPPEPGRGKVGVDDWLYAGHTLDELEALVEAPRLAPVAAAATIELLDEEPLTISRPLALVDGKAYAATWLTVRVTRTETRDKNGSIIRHDPPIVCSEKRLYVVREDGVVFGDGGNLPMDKLGVEVKLPEEIPPGKGWSTAGVKAYASGKRPDPSGVFNQVVSVVDRFLDFDHSLAEQQTMAEFIACYILSTYLLDAFNVIGFLWPNGEKGSGKTHLLFTITELAYLGMVITVGGSFASLRDLADYGATIAFDDAEGLADVKKTDPDKRALLLAGNRRGTTVPLKEPRADGTWKTRYVNAFCPRLFSAIQLPDPTLSSRTIIVPLIRTPDPVRGNADPLDQKLWPCDRKELIDSLWALGLAHLNELPHWDEWIGQASTLVGRNLEPWRAVLAVAGWLESQGVTGIYARIAKLSDAYQKERPELEVTDLTGLTLKVLCNMCGALRFSAISAMSAVSAINRETPKNEFKLFTAVITAEVAKLAKDEEIDINIDNITSRRIGRVMGKMRFKNERESGGKRRLWIVTVSELERWTRAYGQEMPDVLITQQVGLGVNGTNGTVVTNGTNFVDTQLPDIDEDGEEEND